MIEWEEDWTTRTKTCDQGREYALLCAACNWFIGAKYWDNLQSIRKLDFRDKCGWKETNEDATVNCLQRRRIIKETHQDFQSNSTHGSSLTVTFLLQYVPICYNVIFDMDDTNYT